MTKTPALLKVIGYAFGASIVASLGVMLIGMCVFGFRPAEWAEWQGRFAGMAGTIAGVAGAVFGLKLVLRRQRSTVE